MMKKLISLVLALAMLLMCTSALATEDLQAQLDEANAKIEELQALVDKYYPYYASQIVATYGTDGVIWLDDVQEQYDYYEQMYANYGLNLESYGLVDSMKTDIVTSAVKEGVQLAKASELGLDQLDEATEQSLLTSAQETYQSYIDSYINYYYADQEVTDEITEEAEKAVEQSGISVDKFVENLRMDYLINAVYDYAVKDVEITEDDVQTTYEELIESNKESYSDDSTYNSDRNNGTAIAWNPEGYRAVKHVLIKFNDEQSEKYDTLQDQLTSLNEEKEALENPEETTDETTDETTEETAQRTIEEVDADIAACAAELEALYSELMPEAEQVVADFAAGESFDSLIEKYNDDPGMTTEPTASQGYAVCADSTTYDSAFTEGAMSIENVGEISAPVNGSYGIYVIYYMADIPAGEVALDEIRDSVEASALENKQSDTYNAQLDAWIEEANVVYYLDNFGVTTTEEAE